jgi:hypothetical protein
MYLRQAGLTRNPTFRIFNAFGVGDTARLRKPRSNANTHVVGHIYGSTGQMRTMRLLLILSFISTISFGQGKRNFDFSLTIASCFHGDTVRIKINGVELTNNEIVESDFVLGITKLDIFQDNDGLWIIRGQEKIKKNRIEFNKTVSVDVVVNGKETKKEINIKKGKIIFVNNCFVKDKDGQARQRLTFEQYKKTVALM